jgi:hypothetical protein
MLRTIAAVIVGYIVSVILTVIGIFVAWAVFGVEGAFAENSTVASTAWSLTILVLGFCAAVAAGATAAKIGGNQTGVQVLAGLMLVLGLGIAVMSMGVEPVAVPVEWADGEVSFLEAGEVASSPTWYNFAVAFVGAVGVLLGGNLARKPNQ